MVKWITIFLNNWFCIDFGKLYVANSVSLATRVRADILKAVAKRCTDQNDDKIKPKGCCWKFVVTIKWLVTLLLDHLSIGQALRWWTKKKNGVCIWFGKQLCLKEGVILKQFLNQLGMCWCIAKSPTPSLFAWWDLWMFPTISCNLVLFMIPCSFGPE